MVWQLRGQKRPTFAAPAQPGQESVWDYPRPPTVVADTRHVVVRTDDLLLADTQHALRVLETASPPTFYLPAADVASSCLVHAQGRSICEWKGVARYWALAADPGRGVVAWDYPQPSAAFAALRGHFGFYPGRLQCSVAGERVRAQPGGFYAGWVTDEVTGPFKGEPGTEHW